MREGGLLGWATDALVRLDDETPGVLSRVLTASPPRRQAIFAALAARGEKAGVFGVEDESLIPITFAEVIRHGRAADILRHAFGGVPQGFPGLLAQIGERSLPRAKDYLVLHGLLISDDPRGADALRTSGRITCRKLEVLTALDPRWRHANTLDRIDTHSEAMAFNSAVAFIQSVNSKATNEVVANAIALMRPTSSLPKLLDRLLRRADRLPPHPLSDGDNELRPLASMRDLLEAGRKYRNCLAHRLADVAAGKVAIGEFRGECLVEFRPLTQGTGWLLRDVHIERNSPVPLALIGEVEAKCDALGIPRIEETGGGDGWKSYRRFTHELEWG
ncbi:hypothetical protein [Brevundimonas aurantiaca]|jgi:hypothetical protein|uniref:hypothetical protein n=1 Tax=Brevundimonas aurantiaca TaxID=74316 RepID=UPI001749F6D5|nr:hypothetical protein [Brevundimonas aurantiaca]